LVQTFAGVTDVSEVVRMSPNLKVLDLSENPNVYLQFIPKSKKSKVLVEQIGMLHTLQTIEMIAPKIETLSVPLLKFGDKMKETKVFRTLMELDLSDYNLGDTFISEVLQYFEMPNIKLLKYDGNLLTCKGLSELF